MQIILGFILLMTICYLGVITNVPDSKKSPSERAAIDEPAVVNVGNESDIEGTASVSKPSAMPEASSAPGRFSSRPSVTTSDEKPSTASDLAPVGEDPPSPSEIPSVTVAFYGDSQSDTDAEDANHAATVNLIMKSGANPIFHLGDLMEDGTLESLNRFNTVTSSLRSTRSFYAAAGNNERNSSLFFNNFEFPNNEKWYSVNVGNLHAVVLDTAYSSTATGSAQYEWLRNDLQSYASQQRFTVVLFHHPPYGAAGDTKSIIGSIVPLFVENGVDFVMSGHEHVYQKRIVDGVPYYVTSGQPMIGYFIAKVYSEKLQLDYFSSSGVLIESSNVLRR